MELMIGPTPTLLDTKTHSHDGEMKWVTCYFLQSYLCSGTVFTLRKFEEETLEEHDPSRCSQESACL